MAEDAIAKARAIAEAEFTAVVRMLADGYVTRIGTRGAYLHRDAVNGMLRARRGARLTAITSSSVASTIRLTMVFFCKYPRPKTSATVLACNHRIAPSSSPSG